MTKMDLLRLRHQRLVDQFNPAAQPSWEDVTEEQLEGLELLDEDGMEPLPIKTEEDYKLCIKQMREDEFNAVYGPIPYVGPFQREEFVESKFPSEQIQLELKKLKEEYPKMSDYNVKSCVYDDLTSAYLEKNFGTDLSDDEAMEITHPDPLSEYSVWANTKLLSMSDEDVTGIDTFMWGFGECWEYYFTIPEGAESLEDCKGLSGCAG